MHYTHHHSCVPRELPLCVNTAQAADIWAPEDLSGVTCISCSMYFFHYVPGPTCRGSATLYVPPLSYKREGTRRYKTSSLRLTKTLGKFSKLSSTSNTTHSGVGYYAPAARTTLNPRVILCVLPQSSKQAKRLGPFLILGFRAGGFRHPARDFLSDIWRAR
jgi:hypothetical protein